MPCDAMQRDAARHCASVDVDIEVVVGHGRESRRRTTTRGMLPERNVPSGDGGLSEVQQVHRDILVGRQAQAFLQRQPAVAVGHADIMNANPEAPPKLDWAYYKKSIPIPGLVDKFQKEYESFKVPYPADKYTSEVEAQEKEIHVKIEDFIKESNQRIATATKEIDRIKSLLPFSEMTMEDFRDSYPEHAINPDKPTVWPHIPEVQPENEKGQPSHH